MDDNISFCGEYIEECNQVLRVLHEYDVASGQKLNREKKNSLFFSKNTKTETQDEI